ncbi:ABC transporter ATP-binding protein [Paraburkholderia aspalathi]|uniref:Putative spermidine/putrescine transport system ATP-binding protein/putrescine transport system ATP-binding protein n=1 Tax=Paraburkholderia aspalathi TaxID=1324617 RepID=A0A1I7BEX7_9BURK|nr:ABC transporter ATP-binding protein [Paraburkholderia aspalathi]SFT85727.1 putative spermidine/putrescine transport system ATP-binding protein/putrescine transport system ATP-binding protein [Paraburkholderia aspalathi]
MSVLQLSNVTKLYGSFVAVNNISFNVEKGKILSLLGPSGCGKTTTLRLISGFEVPNDGAVMFSGVDMKGRRPYERNVGLLFQDYALFPHMTVRENVAYGLKHRNFDKAKIPARVSEMLSLVKLKGFEDRRPGQLSGGQQQRVALARALAIYPEVVLLDEPLSALDAKLRQELRFELKEILSAVDATTIVVTHDQEEAMSLGDSVIVMSGGKIMQQGAPTDIYTNPKTRFVAEFIGRSNWFTGRLLPSSNGLAEFQSGSGLRMVVPVPDGSVNGTTFDVCVRPERIQINGIGQPSSLAPGNEMRGTIRDVAHLGADLHLVIEIPGGQLLTVTEKYVGQALEQSGQEVSVAFRPSDCIVVPSGS